jgi:cysteine desulfurase/selenocysteine lyase
VRGLDIKRIRKAFPLTEEYIYFNNAATGACSTYVAKALKEYAEARLTLGPEATRWNERIAESKTLFAQLIGAKESEIAFMPNTTAGLNIISDVICTKKGNVVTTEIGFPSNVLVWLKHKHVETRFAKNKKNEIPLEEIRRQIDKNTIAVAVDQVGWFNGFKHDFKAVGEEAHSKGAYFVVDAIQSVGSMKIDVRRDGIDFL